MDSPQNEVTLTDAQYEATTRGAATFGPFRLSVAERLLTKGDEPVEVGARALDVLSTLIAHAGDVVSKRDLFKIVWPDVLVGDGTLRVQIAHLRRMIGDGRDGARYIATISGRGYCFVAPVRRVCAQDHPSAIQ